MTVNNNGTVTLVGVGTATITVSAAETENYKAAQKTITVTVLKKAETPDNTQTPGGNTQTPGENTQIPGENTQTPGENTQTPGENTQTPDDTETTDDTEQIIYAQDIVKTYGAKKFSLNVRTNAGGKLTYNVENKKVAKVDANGYVTIKGCGETDIYIFAAANGDYEEAEEVITLTVKPKKTVLSTPKSKKANAMTVKWKKDTSVKGYLIEYSMDKKFKKKVSTVNVSKNSVTSKTITKLKPGKKYYVRVCAYAVSDGEKIKGKYSSVKAVTIKKK